MVETRTFPLSEAVAHAARRRVRRGSRKHHGTTGSVSERHRAAGPLPRETQDGRFRSARQSAAAACSAHKPRGRRDDVVRRARAGARGPTAAGRRARRRPGRRESAGAHRTRHDRSHRAGNARRQGGETDSTPHTRTGHLLASITTTTTAEILRTRCSSLAHSASGPQFR